jgi:hypothetical protein
MAGFIGRSDPFSRKGGSSLSAARLRPAMRSLRRLVAQRLVSLIAVVCAVASLVTVAEPRLGSSFRAATASAHTRGKNGKDQRSLGFAHAFGRVMDFAQPCRLSEHQRPGANACPISTSWGSLVRAQYRPFSLFLRQRALCASHRTPRDRYERCVERLQLLKYAHRMRTRSAADDSSSAHDVGGRLESSWMRGAVSVWPCRSTTSATVTAIACLVALIALWLALGAGMAAAAGSRVDTLAALSRGTDRWNWIPPRPGRISLK